MSELVLLAAGLGSRFETVIPGKPKVLLALPSGRTLLAEALHNAFATGLVSGAIVVTGYRAGLVDEEVSRQASSSVSVVTVHNPNYSSHGPLYSLWAARASTARKDILVANGDTHYRRAVFEAVLCRSEPGFYLGFSHRTMEHDDVKVALRDGRVVAVGKGVSAADADGVSTGLFSVRGTAARAAFSTTLTDLIDESSRTDRPFIWHDLVHRLTTDGHAIHGVAVDHREWREVDTPEDYDALCTAWRA